MSIVGHGMHAWKKVGRCIYCADCNVLLFQGTLPTSPEMKACMVLCLEQAEEAVRKLHEKKSDPMTKILEGEK